MAESHRHDVQRERVERAAAGLGAGERLWFELHAHSDRKGAIRWTAVVCRPGDAPAVLDGTSESGAVGEFDEPVQLAKWLESLRLRTVDRMPEEWEHLVLFGCEVETLPH